VGVIVIVTAGGISALAVLGTLIALLVTARKRITQQHFVHVVPLFASLLVGDMLQAVGSLMNVQWLSTGKVSEGGYCFTQGGIKQAGNVAIAVWILVIAISTFEMLF